MATCDFEYVLFSGTKSSKDSTARDYENDMSVDNEAYDHSSIVVTSPSRVSTLLVNV